MIRQIENIPERDEKSTLDLFFKQDGSYPTIIEKLITNNFEEETKGYYAGEIMRQFNELKNKFLTLYELSPQGYLTINIHNGLISEANSAAANLLGMRKEILINKNFFRYIPLEYQIIYTNFRQSMLNQKPETTCKIKLFKRSGPVFYAKLDMIFFDNTQIIIQVTALNENGEETENYLQKSKDYCSAIMTAKKEFGSIIAYEISHPLAAINNYIHGCIYRLNKEPCETQQVIHALKKSSQQLNRVSNLILYMRNISYKNQLNYETIYVDSILKETLTNIESEFPDFQFTVIYKQNKNFQKMDGDKIQIQKAIMHLLRNAVEAMRDAEVMEPKLTVHVNYSAKNRIEICIMDNGPGFSKEQAHRLFHPYFTTKPYGMGMGLSISREIVEAHHGELSSELNLTYGSCFKVTLPIRREEEFK